MGTEWQYFINELEIEEPIGFSAIEFDITRDEKMHGMQFEASTSALQFYGESARYLIEQKRQLGLKANVIFRALIKCDVNADYEEVIKGKLNFGKWKETCGKECLVSLPVESETCEVVLKNRFDQKINIDTEVGFDGTTILPEYSGISFKEALKSKALLLIDEAKNTGQTTVIVSDQPGWAVTEVSNIMDGHIAPRLDSTLNSSLGEFFVSAFTQLYIDGAANRPGVNFGYTVDTTSLLGSIKCGLSNVIVTFRVKGSHTIVAPDISSMSMSIKVFKLPATSEPDSFDWVQLYDFPLTPASTTSPTATFDKEGGFNGTLTQGDRLTFSLYIRTTRFGEIDNYSITLDPETYFKITADSVCEDSVAELSFVHETLSRATEAVTNYCMRVKSSYYGRVDSQPFSFDRDGCGGLRFLTSGLKIRRANEDNFFASLKELIEGLQAIDNIGMGVEYDPDRPDNFLLRVEQLAFFYTDQEILFHNAIPESSTEVEESKHYSKITVGYKKWEVNEVNGLDEFNSTREYRTDLSSVSNVLDLTSNLVAGGYPLELTRRQSFAVTGGADTSYDNEIFIITALRNIYGIDPEQGNITDPANIYSPDTAYNFKLRPTANLMRWYKSIANSYAGLTDSNNKLFFNSGTGNTVAAGRVAEGSIDPLCILENQDIAENQNIYTTQFARAVDYTPLFKNETISYEYPMSVAEYRKVKESPYGFIKYQCSDGPVEKGYIKQIKFKPVAGMASFVLKKKW